MSLAPALRRPVVAVAALGVCAAAALPAGATAAATSTAAKGAATSSLTLLRVAVNGNSLTAGEIAAVAGTTTNPHLAKLVITPLDSSLTGPVGQQTVTPSSGTTTVPSTPQSASLPGGLVSLTGPTLTAHAAVGSGRALTAAGLKALGKLTVLTLPINLRAASLTDVAKVTPSGARAGKTASLGALSLPSLADLLSSLGIDLNALLAQLTQGRLTQLAGLVTSTTSGAVKTANDAVDAAQAAVTGSVPATLAKATQSLGSLNGQLSTAQTSLTTATDAFTTAFALIPVGSLPAGLSAATTADDYLAANLSSAEQSALNLLAGADLTSLATTVQTAETQLQVVQDAVDQVQALVTALTQLLNAVLGALSADNDPLAALGNVKVVTSAVASKTMHAKADVSVGALHVLGTALPLASLTSALDKVTGTLSAVLDSVAGVSFTPPSIAVGTPLEQTHRTGRTRFATASITGVTVTLPSITLPAALALPGVPHGVTGSLTLGQLADSAQWTPASATTPGTPSSGGTTPTGAGTPSSGTLADTGARGLLPIVALLLICAGLVLRRRLSSAA